MQIEDTLYLRLQIVKGDVNSILKVKQIFQQMNTNKKPQMF